MTTFGWYTFYFFGAAIFYSPVFMVCAHFAIRKKGNLIVGFRKKAALGLLASTIWMPCFILAFVFIDRVGVLSSLPDFVQMILVLTAIPCLTILPAIIFAEVSVRVLSKWTYEPKETKYWRGIGLGTFTRAACLIGAFALASLFLGFVPV